MFVTRNTCPCRAVRFAVELFVNVAAATQIVKLFLDQFGNLQIGFVAIKTQTLTSIVDIVVMTGGAPLTLMIDVCKRHRQQTRHVGVCRVVRYCVLLLGDSHGKQRCNQQRGAQQGKQNPHQATAFMPTNTKGIAGNDHRKGNGDRSGQRRNRVATRMLVTTIANSQDSSVDR